MILLAPRLEVIGGKNQLSCDTVERTVAQELCQRDIKQRQWSWFYLPTHLMWSLIHARLHTREFVVHWPSWFGCYLDCNSDPTLSLSCWLWYWPRHPVDHISSGVFPWSWCLHTKHYILSASLAALWWIHIVLSSPTALSSTLCPYSCASFFFRFRGTSPRLFSLGHPA